MIRYLNRIVWILLALSVLSACKKEATIDFCNTSPEAIDWSNEDAFALSIKHIYKDSSSIFHTYKDSVKIPGYLFELIQTRLGAIYDNDLSPQRDTVIDLYEIYTLPYFVNGELIMRMETNTPWVQQFLQGLPITTDSLVKSMFDKYGIAFKSFMFDPNPNTEKVYLKTKPYLNIINLCEELESLNGVLYGYPEYVGAVFGNNRDLKIDLHEDTSIIEFVSFGGHHWKFEVYDDCSTSFIGH